MWWRSLFIKQLQAFLVVSIIGVLIVGFFLRVTTQQGFDTYVQAQAKHDLVMQLGSYYQALGSWNNIAAFYHQPDATSGLVSLTVLDNQNTVVLAGTGYTVGQVVPASVITAATPILVDQRVVGRAVFPTNFPNNPLAQTYSRYLNEVLLLASAVALLVAFGVALLFSNSLTRPVRALTSALHAMTSGKLHQQVSVASRDELGELANAFNSMSAEIALGNQQRRQLTADIAHDLQTPVMLIAGYITAIRDGVLPLTAERMTVLAEESQRLQRLIEDLRTLSLADTGEISLYREPITPVSLIDRLIAIYTDQAAQKGITLQRQVVEPLPLIDVDRERMIQVFGNLMVNALRYTPDGGTITLGVEPAGQGVAMTVRDTGIGIAPEVLPRIFDRFFREDRARSTGDGGSGLGLAIAKAIVEAHGGTISVVSRIGSGTCFEITLPKAMPELDKI